MTHRHTTTPDHAPAVPGVLIRWPRRYDLLVGMVLAGRGSRVRTQIADTLELGPGHRVLDVGCGTGTLTLTLASRVGARGTVVGVDASGPMITAARGDATRQRLPVRFEVAAAQELPYPDESFDAVATSLMIHHLPAGDRLGAVTEMLRVLRPGGRLVIAEFQAPTCTWGRRLTEHLLGHSMATNNLAAIVELASAAGVEDGARSATSVGWLGLVSGRRPAAEPTSPSSRLPGPTRRDGG